MKWIIAILVTATSITARAQTAPLFSGDTCLMLPEVDIHAKWKNDTDRYRYNQMKYYVTTILPYLNASTKLFGDIRDKKNVPGIGRKEYKLYVHTREEEMRTQFEDRLRDLNVTQGELLVKLIARQTEVNIYEILKDFKNPLTAVKWQAWARMNGMNLDKRYDPESEPMLEHIMDDLGYPLPASYVSSF